MSGLRSGALFARADAFLRAGVLDLVDLHVVDRLAALVDERDLDVLLGLAFALRAPRFGHVGVDLETVAETIGQDSPIETKLPWPIDRAHWKSVTHASMLVASTVDEAKPRPFVAAHGLLTTLRHHRLQMSVATALIKRASTPFEALASSRDGAATSQRLATLLGGDERTERQRMAVLTALKTRLAVIVGGPGTGKTFTVKMILAMLLESGLAAPKIALAAPTGKAAARIAESIRDGLDALPIDETTRASLGSLRATTLHRLLGIDPSRGGRPRYDRTHPLPHDVVIVDETSMIDLAMMARLLAAVRDGARLVLLGDADQLASVEAGSVLADLTSGDASDRIAKTPSAQAPIALNEPVTSSQRPLLDAIVRLHAPRRHALSGGIARVARAIAEGTPRSLDAAAAWLFGERAEGEGPFEELESLTPNGADLPATIVDRVVSVALAVVDRVGSHDAAATLDEALAALESTRILAAHRRGALGVETINDTIVRAILDARPMLRRRGFDWPGRPVLITENRPDVGRLNGDVGLLVDGDAGVRAAFRGPGVIEYLQVSRLPKHETVFAMTVHKSQGSQLESPIVVLPERPSPVVTRELVYTAITRASRRVTLVSSRYALRAALDRRPERASSLGAMLWGQG